MSNKYIRNTFKQLSPNLMIDKIDDNDDAFISHQKKTLTALSMSHLINL